MRAVVAEHGSLLVRGLNLRDPAEITAVSAAGHPADRRPELVDNIRTAHSREAYEGPREVLVGMAEPIRISDVSTTNP